MSALFGYKYLLAIGLAPALLVSAAPAQRPVDPVRPRVVTLPCCKCVGETMTANLSTGAAPWRVMAPYPGLGGGGPIGTNPTELNPAGTSTERGGRRSMMPPVAVPVSPASNAGWSFIPGSSWVGPGSGVTTPGQFVYETRLNLRNRVIPSASITISGSFLADNGAQVFVDGNPLASSGGTVNYGFLPGSLTTFSYTFPANSAGVHSLSVNVTNQSGPTGLNLQATATRRCVTSPERPTRGTGTAIPADPPIENPQ